MLFPEEKLAAISISPKDKGPVAPQWIEGATLYEIYTRNFTSSGDFKGILSRISYLKLLGVKVLWLMPIHPIGEKGRKGTLGSPYSILNHQEINPEYGDKKDFRLLVKTIHSEGMKVIIDLVANHGANDNVLFKKFPKTSYYDAKGNPTRRVKDWSDVADFNYDNPKVWEYIENAALYWVKEFDIDGYRCDVAGMVPLEFWESLIKKLLKVKKDLFMLAEWEHPALCRKAFHSDYTIDIYHKMLEVKKGKMSAQELIKIIQKRNSKYPLNYLPLNFIENHDQPRARTAFGLKGYHPFAVLIFAIPGIPLIYNGQEVGFKKALNLFEKDTLDWANASCEVFNFYQNLIKLRTSSPWLSKGKIIPMSNTAEKKVATAIITTSKKDYFLLLHFHRGQRRVIIPKVNLKEIIPILSNNSRVISSQELELQSFAIYWGELANKHKEANKCLK